jgi:lysosomal acid lipase/cholesteryl ester hydrolase
MSNYQIDFLSWDQMGQYDIPAMMNKVLEVSGQEKIYYIGHSMGTTGYFLASAGFT